MRVAVTAICAMVATTVRRNPIATPPAAILNNSRFVVTQSDPDIAVITAVAAANNAPGRQARE
jgi:hypothetical protein